MLRTTSPFHDLTGRQKNWLNIHAKVAATKVALAR